LGEELFRGTPRCRGYGEECFEAKKEFCTRKWACESKERVRTKVKGERPDGKIISIE